MSFLDLDSIRRRPWPPVATGVTALVVACGVVDMLTGGLAQRWFGLWLGGAGPSALVEVWRPLTFGVVTQGFISTVFAALFGYWILSSAERQWGWRDTLLVCAATLLAIAAAAVWLVPGHGIIGGASMLGWGVICASTYHAWRRGANVRDQLIILALCGMMTLTGGALGLVLLLAASVGGVAAAHLLFEVRLTRKAPTGPDAYYDAFRRQRQGRGAAAGGVSSSTLVLGLCAVLALLWAARMLIG